MKKHTPFTFVLFASLCLLALPGVCKAAESLITLSATRDVILADGRQQTVIIANVRDSSGNPLNGATVEFQTSAGTLTENSAVTVNGVARTRLTSATTTGIANVVAFADGQALGASKTLQIYFTNDPQATVQGNEYITITGKYVAYSTTDHMIYASSINGGALLTYRNFSVRADTLELQANNNANVRAQGDVLLKRGKSVVHAVSLNYSMATGQGYAIALWKGRMQQVTIGGMNLQMAAPHGFIPPRLLALHPIQTRLVVVAHSITYMPGSKLQFRGASFYQDDAKILTLPFYEMGVNDHQLFSDHFLSIGTTGLGLTLPFYYDLSPRTSGEIILQHQQQLGRGYYSTDPGWSLDLLEGYNGGGDNAYQGKYGFTGLTRGNWGFQWTHSQSFGPNTQGALYLDFPNHNGVFGDVNLNSQMKRMSVGLDLSAGESFVAGSSSSVLADAYIESVPHSFKALPGMFYSLGTRVNYGVTNSADPLTQAADSSSGEVSLRFFTRPRALDRLTTFSQSYTFAHIWTTGPYSGFKGLIDYSLSHTFHKGGDVSLSYDYISTPLSALDSGGKHRISLSWRLPPVKRFGAELFGTSYLDAPSASFLADMVYRLDNRWRLLFSSTLHTDNISSFRDLEFTIGRRIGARELQLTYSTYSKRFSVDLTSTNW